MGNRKVRELAKQQADQAAWDRFRTERRLAIADVGAPGIGARRIQLIVMPSFAAEEAWEVWQLHGRWSLSRSSVIRGGSLLDLVGYEPLPAKDEILASFFGRLTALSISLTPRLEELAGADGTSTQLALFGSLSSQWRFQWWSEPPPQWKPMVEIADEMTTLFRALGSTGTSILRSP